MLTVINRSTSGRLLPKGPHKYPHKHPLKFAVFTK